MGVPNPIVMALSEYDCQDQKKTVRVMKYPTKWQTHDHLKWKYEVLWA